MIKLTITEKGGEPRPLSFEKEEVTIGRVQGNDIVLPKGNISKRHSKLQMSDGKLVVADLKSTNGTYVNGRKISDPVPLQNGDRIFVGDFLIVVDGPSAAAVTTESVRRPTPPPPPPPRSRPGIDVAGQEHDGLEAEDEELAGLRSSPSAGRGRGVVPPPPPPPRRTMPTSDLEDDSVDIGFGDAPPAPSEVAADAAVDVAEAAPEMFAGTPAEIAEDATGGFPGPSTDNRSAPRMPSGTTALPGSGPARVAAASEAVAAVGLEALLADSTVSAIVIPTGETLDVERADRKESLPAAGDANTVAEAIWRLASTAQPPPPPDNPVVDVRLPDGTRVTALFPPIASGAISAVIRKPPQSAHELAAIGGSQTVAEILNSALQSRLNILLAGDLGAMSAVSAGLAAALPAGRKIVTIGARLPGRPGCVDLAVNGDPAALWRAALAFRADHVLLGEPIGAEAADLVLGAARGQDGIIAPIAARSTDEALARLRALAVGALGSGAVAPLARTAFDLLVFAASGERGPRILEIAEPGGSGEGLSPLTVLRTPGGRGDAAPELVGISSKLAELINDRGGSLPAQLSRR